MMRRLDAEAPTDAANNVVSPSSVFLRVWACFGLALFAVTWKLWTPQNLYPQVPVFEVLVNAPVVVDWLALGLIFCSLALLAFQPRLDNVRSRWLITVFAVSLCVSFLLDQHRLQPWAWHWFVFATIFTLASFRDAMFWLRWIVISVYVYSAISKLDYQFTHSVGLEMLHAMADLIGVSLVSHSPESLSRFVLLLPLVELLAGIGSAFVMTRRLFGWLAMLLHVGLLLILGPWGLNHQSPVLIWNAFFIFQAYWLFVRQPQAERSSQPRLARAWAAAVVALFVILFPATCSFGGCDHWLAWELYAPRSSRVTVELPGSAIDQLPYSAGNYTKNSQWMPGVVELDLARWSLEELGVPVYPNARFQLGVARAVSDQLDDERFLRVQVKSHSNRRTGQRSSQQIRGTSEMKEQSSEFWLNTVPRAIELRRASPVD